MLRVIRRLGSCRNLTLNTGRAYIAKKGRGTDAVRGCIADPQNAEHNRDKDIEDRMNIITDR